MNYILNGKETVKKSDILEWAKWFEKENRTVEKTKIGDSEISTVFLGIDHSFGGGIPLLFETMVFGGAMDGEQDRYSTWTEAEIGHKNMCDRVRNIEP